MIKIIILDFDGIVVESVDIKTEAFKELFKECENVDDIVQYHLQNNAISRFIKFKYIYKNFLRKEYTEETEEEVGNRFSEIVFQKVVECSFVVGAEEFLRTFSDTRPIYLITAGPQEELERIVAKRDIQSYFKSVWGTPRTKVDLIKKALANEKANPEEAIYIGDMKEDYRIAKNVDVQFVGRRNVENFDGLNIPIFPDMRGIRKWVQDKIEDRNV